jgi:hypothetical protein
VYVYVRTTAVRAMRGAALARALTERLRYSGPAHAPCMGPPAMVRCDHAANDMYKRRTQDGRLTFHLFCSCECTHPAVEVEREALHSTLPSLLARRRLATVFCKTPGPHTKPNCNQRLRGRDSVSQICAARSWPSQQL